MSTSINNGNSEPIGLEEEEEEEEEHQPSIVSWTWFHTDSRVETALRLKKEADNAGDGDDDDPAIRPPSGLDKDGLIDWLKGRVRRLEQSLSEATTLLVDVDADLARLQRKWAGVQEVEWTSAFQARGLFEMSFPSVQQPGTMTRLQIQQQPSDAPVGFVVWEASFTLCDYLLRTFRSQQPLSGKTVVEIGCGCGLLGLIMHELGATVYLTDKENTTGIAQVNAELNGIPFRNLVGDCSSDHPSDKIQCRLFVTDLTWSEENVARARREGRLPEHIDFIVASELLYSFDIQPPLLEALIHLSTADTVTYICYETRGVREPFFFEDRLPKHFKTVEHVYESNLHPLDEEERKIVHGYKISGKK